MKEFVEKMIEGLEELRVRNFLTIANTGDDKLDCAYEYVGKVLDNTISIINELAEKYSAITPQNLEKVVKEICDCDSCSGCCNCYEEQRMECEDYVRVLEIVRKGGVE